VTTFFTSSWSTLNHSSTSHSNGPTYNFNPQPHWQFLPAAHLPDIPINKLIHRSCIAESGLCETDSIPYGIYHIYISARRAPGSTAASHPFPTWFLSKYMEAERTDGLSFKSASMADETTFSSHSGKRRTGYLWPWSYRHNHRSRRARFH
jgi:hypothetical protein